MPSEPPPRLPSERRLPVALLTDRAHVLTAADIATLEHILARGLGANSLRALTSDLTYLEAWALAATNAPLPWPPDAGLVLKFLAHHLYDPDARARDPAHGMPGEVAAELRAGGFLRSAGPHAPATIRRRLSSWRTLCRWRGDDGPFEAPRLRRATAAALRAQTRPRRRKSARAVSAPLLRRLLAHLDRHCGPTPDLAPRREAMRLRALRDRALLATAWASGGRRRSEVAELQVSMIADLAPLAGEDGRPLPVQALHIGRTKTTSAEEGLSVLITGRTIALLAAWRRAAGIETGFVFRPVTRWGRIGATGISPAGVNSILKQRLAEIGEDPAEFSAHGLRAGYMTEALKAGIPLPEAMAQSGHASPQQAASYFQDEERRRSRAARLLEE